ncbi:MAG: SDR family oxidoreductase [Planctomycetaceae bacterium]
MTTPQTIVVFGGTSDIAKATAYRLLKTGTNLLLTARTEHAAEELQREFHCETGIAVAADSSTIDACVKKAEERFGTVDGVVNCMGSLLLKPAHITSDREWTDTLTTNLTSSFYIVRAAAKAMSKQGGSIVLISSAAASIGLANHEAIAAAKAGILGLMRSAASTYANRGIRVNAVAPGLIKSKLTRKICESETSLAASSQMHAIARPGTPEEVASAITWLLDPENKWITGQTIGVDGGLGSVVPRAKL